MVESNIFFGTGFPQQTERDKRLGATDAGQFLPAWKQEARDEQGRRRFHGAFTGGFSAGYFNTVGSKEGWTPSQFVSSRSSRGEQKVAKIEDFMDEEDLQELASTKRLVTTDEFDTLAGTEKELEKRRQQLDNDAKRHGGGDMTFLTSSLMNLVAPAEDSTGMRLLRKMGWRPGQGVGPRTAFVKNHDDDDDDDYGNNQRQQELTLAPKDTPIVDYQAKTNTFGLGYDLVQHVPQVAEMRRFQQQQQDQQSRSNKSSAGFSLGVFDNDNDNDYNDDMTLYDDDDTTGFSNKYHHTLYDDTEYHNKGTLSIKNKRKNQQQSISVDRLSTKKARCSDGHLPLKGFHLSTQSQEIGAWYPPPSVPAHFDGLHTQKQQQRSISKKTPHESAITIDARGAMLGEKPIEARSVFDYMSSKTKDLLAQAKLAATTTATAATAAPVDKTRLQVTLIPKDMAQLALRGFIPFGDTPGKQERYRHFLETSINTTDTSTNTTTFDLPPGMTHEAGMKELDEFIQAARIFRPISSMMSGRFTTSSTPTTPTSTTTRTNTTNIEQVSFEGGLKTEEQWKKEKEIREKQVMDEPKPKLSQEAEAAAMNMFGPMTRTQHAFYPNRLLCKRFNVRNPHPDHVPQGPGHRTQAGSTSALDEKAMASMLAAPSPQHTSKKLVLADTQHDDPALRAIIAKPSSRTPPPPMENDTSASMVEEKKGDDDDDDHELDYERPAMDIFKAIFETSDDDDDDDDDDADNDDSKNNSQQPPPSTTTTATMMDVDNDNDQFIGPPIPLEANHVTNHHSPAPPTAAAASSETVSTPFRPIFTKRESQDTKIHSYEQQFMVTPFESRLDSSSSSHKQHHRRRRVSVSSDSSEEEEDNNNNSDKNDDDLREKKKRHHRRRRHHHHSSSNSSSSKKRKDSKKKKNKEESSSERKKRKYDSDNEDRHRRHRHSRKGHDDGDNNNNDHHRSSSRNDEADLSLWVEKQPSVPRRSRAEDLW